MQDSTDEMYDVVVVGAGFGGMYLLRRLRDELGLRVLVVERGDTVGGTWYWNRYPGARCDAESIFYSYSFDSELQQTWTWSEKYATQPEILAYAEHVADRYELRRDIAFGVEVTGAAYDEARNIWTVHTSTGELTAKYFITAMGCLSASRIPDLDGLGEFNGTVVHTADWPREGVDLSGKRVAMIGTGSTGIQLLPQIAPQADRVTVFQRTANYSVPARNRRLGPDEYTRIRSVYRNLWEQARFSPGGQILASPAGSVLGLDRATAYSHLEQRWSEGGPGFIAAFTDTMLNENANDVSADFVRDRIREIVRQPETADLLCPRGYPIGSKRICVDTDYYETFNRDNVELVSIRETPIERITPDGVVVDGALYPADVIIFATGFDAITGPFTRLDIRGREGRSLRDEWSAGPGTYLGLTVHGFPNMFMVTGPGSPSVLSNMIASIEQHVDWIADYLTFMANVGIVTTEATASAQESWVSEVNEVAHATLYVKGASWYMGANVPGKPRVFMPYAGGVGTYRQHCDLVAAKGYPGFSNTFRDFEPARAAVRPTRSDGVGPDLASASHA
ncbi:MAG: cyclohexanone monooxygenase [Gordonia sp.]|nr:cyclohexanone monooxygenase [Gordonia sp. (in: high G+C Gram-positive bacteria)]